MFLQLDMFETKACKTKQELYLQRAAAVAGNSNCHNHRHGTVIVNRRTDEIVAEGFNHFSTHMCHLFSCHSEVDALLKIRKYPKHMIPELDLYVVRIGTDHMGRPLKYSKPCAECAQAILKFGIKKVFFSTDENFNSKMNEFKKPNHVRAPLY
jgi:deoxycytidylate deaminase